MAAEVVVLEEVIDVDAVDTQRAEQAGHAAVDDHHAHHQLVDAVAAGERDSQRGDDADREDRADGHEEAGQCEEDPRHDRTVAAHRAHRPTQDDVDRAVLLGEAEEVGQTHQRDHEVDGETTEDLVEDIAGVFGGVGELGDGQGDEEGADEAEDAEVDVAQGSEQEDQDEDTDRQGMHGAVTPG